MTQTTIYLDVDGVINSLSQKPPKTNTGWDEWEQLTILGFPISFSHELVRRINTLAAREDVQFCWLTTWLDEAPRHLPTRLGIDGADWPVLGLGTTKTEMMNRHVWWKYAEFMNHDRGDSRWVWVDDDHKWELSDQDLLDMGDNGMLVTPRSLLGITRKQMEAIESFCE